MREKACEIGRHMPRASAGLVEKPLQLEKLRESPLEPLGIVAAQPGGWRLGLRRHRPAWRAMHGAARVPGPVPVGLVVLAIDLDLRRTPRRNRSLREGRLDPARRRLRRRLVVGPVGVVFTSSVA